MVGFFATDTVYAGYNGTYYNSVTDPTSTQSKLTQSVPLTGLFYGTAHAGGLQLARQLYGTVVCGGWAAFMSYVILKGNLRYDHCPHVHPPS